MNCIVEGCWMMMGYDGIIKGVEGGLWGKRWTGDGTVNQPENSKNKNIINQPRPIMIFGYQGDKTREDHWELDPCFDRGGWG